MIETTGYVLGEKKRKKREDNSIMALDEVSDKIEKMEKAEEENTLPLKAFNIFTGAKTIL